MLEVPGAVSVEDVAGWTVYAHVSRDLRPADET